jgi:hypothetical protein
MPSYKVTFKTQSSPSDSGCTHNQSITASSPQEAAAKAKQSYAGKGKIVTIISVK